MLPAIYFTFSRKKCDENAIKCSSIDLLNKEEALRAAQMVDAYIAENPIYTIIRILNLLKGIASHHAGLLPGWKTLSKGCFRKD